MSLSIGRRTGVFALLALVAAFAIGPAAADTGEVRLKFFKAGWFVGAQGGSGILSFKGQIHALHIGGISAGLTFGGSVTDLVGTARNLRTASDIEGVYTAIGAGVAIAAGQRAVTMQNARGVILTLQGQQLGLQVDLDLSGMTVSIK
jgi:lipid-binding SYLF domain-containing protein